MFGASQGEWPAAFWISSDNPSVPRHMSTGSTMRKTNLGRYHDKYVSKSASLVSEVAAGSSLSRLPRSTIGSGADRQAAGTRVMGMAGLGRQVFQRDKLLGWM